MNGIRLSVVPATVLLLSATMLLTVSAGAAELRKTVLGDGGQRVVSGSAVIQGTTGQGVVRRVAGGAAILQSGFWGFIGVLVDVEEIAGPAVPVAFVLRQNHPNPLRTGTVIGFGVPEGGGDVFLAVYDLTGRRVRTLHRSVTSAGHHTVEWDRRDGAGREVAAGTYFYVLDASGNRITRKLTVLR